ncbi:MAG: helix-turn-helix transcriptional regulator [Candidatus Omnitrophica bacterium]|nr:helix-turn-helix transcriptional regulator [Candidatus Omnitrophota bacterium]
MLADIWGRVNRKATWVVVSFGRCFYNHPMQRPLIRYEFGRRLRELRKLKGWTQEGLAERADIAYKHVQRLEGKTPSPVKIDTLEKLADAFKIPVWKLLQFKD